MKTIVFFLKTILLCYLLIGRSFDVKCLDIFPAWGTDRSEPGKYDWLYGDRAVHKGDVVEKTKNLAPSGYITSFSPIIKKSSPAVVEIYAFQITENRLINPYIHDPAYDFFKFYNQFAPQRQVQQSSGSGVIISEDGIIATCAHVVQGANTIKIRLNDGREYTADVIIIDDKEDLALIKIKLEETVKFPFLKIGDIDLHEVGDVVLALGNAFGLGQTVTSGIISAPLRAIKDKVVIQTDASVNPGNSGGALINLNGELIGIPNAIISKSGAFHGVGFCRPANIVQSMLKYHLEKAQKGWLGIYVQKLTNDMIKAIGDEHVGSPQGVIVTDLHSQSPAKKEGVLQGDVILKINKRPIVTEHDFYYRQQLIASDESVELTIWRKGKIEIIKVKAVLPPKDNIQDKFRIVGLNPLKGYVIAHASPAIALELGIDDRTKGVVVVETPSKRSPVKIGDVIQQINDSKIDSIQDAISALETKTRNWLIILKRGNQKIALQTN